MLALIGRLLGGLALSSVVAVAAFHLGLFIGLGGIPSPAAPSPLRASLGVFLFEVLLVFLIGLVIALPSFIIAQKMGKANVWSASLLGALIGLGASALYGGLEAQSLLEASRTFALFCIPGLLGGVAFWIAAGRGARG